MAETAQYDTETLQNLRIPAPSLKKCIQNPIMQCQSKRLFSSPVLFMQTINSCLDITSYKEFQFHLSVMRSSIT